MLFNSYQFLFLFFPIALAAFFIAHRFGLRAQVASILFASFLFYAAWDIRFLVLLIGSIAVNYGIGFVLEGAVRQKLERRASMLLTFGVALNLVTLGVFKYAHFIVDNVSALGGPQFVIGRIILPLGISFFTFEQIGYLIDIRRGHLYGSGPMRYATFVAFFPRLVAGPILRYNEILPQITEGRSERRPADDIAVGLTIFIFGLFKKAVLADSIAPFATTAFAAAAGGQQIDFLVAWAGALAYTCQLYFDFSGYSDMAIGAARCFGIRFPMNFNSPYKAASIIEFWRRWHMTLSRFLRDYLYVSLGGNRRGPVRRYANLMITMLLGGLWHGASWTFVMWGALHGFYLMINHGWIAAARSFGADSFRFSALGKSAGSVVTFLSVVIAWVFFRAPNVSAATNMLAGMAFLHGISIPSGLAYLVNPVAPFLARIGVVFGDGSGSQLIYSWLWIVGLLTIAFLFPNTQQLMMRYSPVLETQDIAPARRWSTWLWKPSIGWAILVGVVGFISIISITRVSEFLYWQF